MAEWTISTHPNNQSHIGISSSTVRACSYRYYLIENNTEWTISTPTTSPCEVWLFEIVVISTVLSVIKNSKILAVRNLENFVLEKKLLGKNENQKMKQKIQIQVT